MLRACMVHKGVEFHKYFKRLRIVVTWNVNKDLFLHLRYASVSLSWTLQLITYRS